MRDNWHLTGVIGIVALLCLTSCSALRPFSTAGDTADEAPAAGAPQVQPAELAGSAGDTADEAPPLAPAQPQPAEPAGPITGNPLVMFGAQQDLALPEGFRLNKERTEDDYDDIYTGIVTLTGVYYGDKTPQFKLKPVDPEKFIEELNRGEVSPELGEQFAASGFTLTSDPKDYDRYLKVEQAGPEAVEKAYPEKCENPKTAPWTIIETDPVSSDETDSDSSDKSIGTYLICHLVQRNDQRNEQILQVTFTPKAQDLGRINLALHLTLGTRAPDFWPVLGEVVTDEALVFPEATVDQGRLYFTPDGNLAMILKSGTYYGGEFAAGRSIRRRFTLNADRVSPDGSELAGKYYETITGFGPEPITVMGDFALQRPVFRSTPETAPTEVPNAPEPGALAFDALQAGTPTPAPAAEPAREFSLTQTFGGFSWFERIFVDSSYTGSEERGTVEQPYKTIRAAYENAPPWSTIVIRVGTYDESPAEFRGKWVDWEVEGKGLVILK
ncbi:MAG: hypothetical protein ACE5LU_14865 [Anaerolineae bacterium]